MEVDYRIIPEFLNDMEKHRFEILKQNSTLSTDFQFEIIRRNIDARTRPIQYVMRAKILTSEQTPTNENETFVYNSVEGKSEIHIIGAGPCGYFAALECIRQGYKPIVLERGKDVQSRRRDLRAIQQFGIVDPHSNYCFGEGGAGTYSDGKLYTRSDKRGNIKDVLKILVAHGAHKDILVDVHPHIGSNKLPSIIQNIRQTILDHGGEIHFDTFISDFTISNSKIVELISSSKTFSTQRVILATGHSSRDIFTLLQKKNIEIEAKPFAIGVRIEHPQGLIDQMQYKQNPREENLPAASYGISCQIDQKGVFSFCMCPGGLIVPAATSPGEIVVNGMSLSKRDSPYANSGFVTQVDDEDFVAFNSEKALRAMSYQANIEQTIFAASDGTQRAPAQKITDFISKKMSQNLPSSSYIPGLLSAPVHELLPSNITQRLISAMKYFGKRMNHFLSQEAILVATESRTSSPVKIPRDKESCHHPQIQNLYPAGEGAGYAGGILSAAMDGQRVVTAITKLQSKY
ncbi:MAG: FAD-binding protein [Saprospiraceae bacterium]|nr:FAD-binding protein [Saprospiraceae bacterium]